MVTGSSDLNVYKSSRNISGVTTTVAHQINVLDLFSHETLILTREAVARIERCSPVKNPHDIILKPLITEKSTALIEENKYTLLWVKTPIKLKLKRLWRRFSA